ncbi:hypothetical protein JCM10207_006555 [Rhodosporidiobolus poonsookiae]
MRQCRLPLSLLLVTLCSLTRLNDARHSLPSMSTSSPSTADRVDSLKHILTRTGQLELQPDDLEHVLQALSSTDEASALALAILSRFLNPSPTSTTRSTLQTTLKSLLSGTNSHDLIRGLSALSAVLQVAPLAAASLLQDPALRSRLEDAVEHISNPIGKGKAKQDDETLALVELLSLAAGQPGMRALVRSTAGQWLESLLGEPTRLEDVKVDAGTARRRVLAAVGVVKLRLGKDEPSTAGLPTPPEEEAPSKWSLEDLARLFVISVTSSRRGSSDSHDGKVLLPALEGLAYLTLTSSSAVKAIATDSAFLSCLFSAAPKAPTAPTATSSALDYAVATLLDHLTAFPALDADSDAAQVERLKRFAAAAVKKGQPAPERESVESVTARITKLVQHDPSPMPTIRQLCLSPSLQTRRLAAKILHSLVTPQPLRGQLLQAGAARLFLSLIRQLSAPFSPTDDVPAVQGLAKLLITANPLLVLGPTASSPLLLEATTALTLPLGVAPSSSPVPLLATFESLMALTNLASLDPALTDQLARLTLRDRPGTRLLTAIDELLLSTNTMVRRAATELLCNLAASDAGIEYYEPSSPPSSSPPDKPPSQRLHVVLALSSAPDTPTRLAATGALASLACSPSSACALAAFPRWREILLDLARGDDEPGVRHRVYEVWRVVGEAVAGGEASEEVRAGAREGLKEGQVVEGLREAETKEKVVQLREVVQAAREAVERAVV